MENNYLKAYNLFKEHIVYAKYLPGERLIESELVENYKCSRLHIRKVLQKLNDEGLVELVPNKGARIARMTLEEIVDSYGLLEVLELYAVKLYLPNLTKNDLRKIEKINNQLSLKAKERDFANYVAGNLDFHITLSSFGNNSLLTEFVKNLRHRNIKYSYFVLALSDYMEKFIEQHRDIIKACYDKNFNLLNRTLKEHISDVKDNVILNFKRKYKSF